MIMQQLFHDLDELVGEINDSDPELLFNLRYCHPRWGKFTLEPSVYYKWGEDGAVEGELPVPVEGVFWKVRKMIRGKRLSCYVGISPNVTAQNVVDAVYSVRSKAGLEVEQESEVVYA